MTNLLDRIKPVLRLFWPKFYNRSTWVIITFALPLLSKPLWIEILNIFLPELKLQIIGQYDWLIGLLLIVSALVYNIISRYHELKYRPVDNFAFERVSFKKAKTFIDLAQEILPLLKENEYIFKNLGPNSNFDSEGELRTDLTLWHKKKVEIIEPNNDVIKELLERNKEVIPQNHLDLIQQLKMHIDAFKEHLRNPNFDYRQHQFPIEFYDLILDSCKTAGYNSRIINKSLKWLSKRISKLDAKDWFLFGSILLYPKKALDTDIALQMQNTSQFDSLGSLKIDYKLKFKKNLDITVFHSDENDEYEKFKSLNHIKNQING